MLTIVLAGFIVYDKFINTNDNQTCDTNKNQEVKENIKESKSFKDVAFKYEINVTPNEESAVKDLVTTGYSVDDGEKIEFSEFNSPISETVNLSNENKTKKIRIYIIWNDNPDTSSMDNLSDTSSTLKADSSAILDVSVAFTQVAQ